MSFQFRYEDGDRTMRDEDGNLVIDDNDVQDCITLPAPLCSLSNYEAGQPLSSIDSSIKEPKVVKATKGRKDNESSRTYRKYTLEDRNKLILLYDEYPGRSIPDIAKEVGVKVRTAQTWVRKFNEGGGLEVPAPEPRGRASKPKLSKPHKEFLTSFVDDNPSAILVDMVGALSNQFEGLLVSKSTVHRFLTKDLSFTFKLARKEPVDRNSAKLIEARFDFVKKIKDLNVDYLRDCVFIDEAAFNYNLTRSQGWALKGETPVVKTPTTRAESKTVLGAICYRGIVQLTLRQPFILSGRKKRKFTGETAADVTRGTNTGHFKQFLLNVMDELDKDEQLSGMYLVMDNASIHKSVSVERIVIARGYKVLYLPPYSPELNPIEQFWHQLKSKIKRVDLGKDSMAARIGEAGYSIPPENIENCIKHSVKCFERCEAREPL